MDNPKPVDWHLIIQTLNIIALVLIPLLNYFFITKKYEKLKHVFLKKQIFAEKRVEILSEYFLLLTDFFEINLKDLLSPSQMLSDREISMLDDKYGKPEDELDYIKKQEYYLTLSLRERFTAAEDSRVKMTQYFLHNKPWFTPGEEKMIEELNKLFYEIIVDYKTSRKGLGGSEDLQRWKDLWEEIIGDGGVPSTTVDKLKSTIRTYYYIDENR
jgi:hypothetical protein